MSTEWKLKQGTKVIANGYAGVIVRHYDGNMYEIRLKSGVICTENWTLVDGGTSEPKHEQHKRGAKPMSTEQNTDKAGGLWSLNPAEREAFAQPHAQHSPLPFSMHVDERGKGCTVFDASRKIVARCDEEQGKLIVRAVNHAEKLAEALDKLTRIAWKCIGEQVAEDAIIQAKTALAAYEEAKS